VWLSQPTAKRASTALWVRTVSRRGVPWRADPEPVRAVPCCAVLCCCPFPVLKVTRARMQSWSTLGWFGVEARVATTAAFGSGSVSLLGSATGCTRKVFFAILRERRPSRGDARVAARFGHAGR